MIIKSLVSSLVLLIVSFIIIHVYGENFHIRKVSNGNHHETIRRLQSLKASLTRHDSIASTPSSFSPSPSPSSHPNENMNNPRVFHVTSYGADPIGNSDSTEAILAAIVDASNVLSEGHLMEGINNLGGSQVNLEGGNYTIRRSLMLPISGVGNLMVFRNRNYFIC